MVGLAYFGSRRRERLMGKGNQAGVDVFVGVDVGKKDHHAVALDAAGKVLLDRSLPQDNSGCGS